METEDWMEKNGRNSEHETVLQAMLPESGVERNSTSAERAFNATKDKPCKPKVHLSTWKLVVLSVTCALLGSFVGGGIVAVVMSNHAQARQTTERPPSISAIQPKQQTEQPPQSSPGEEQPLEQTPATHPIESAQDDEIMTPSEVYYQNVSSVVGIANEGTKKNAFGQTAAIASSGTGFLVSEDGYIVTNHHVAENAQTLTVTLYDGTQYPATLVGADSELDVALLKIDAQGLSPVVLGDSDTLVVGECVEAIGNPLGELTYTMTLGYISAKDREINVSGRPVNMLQTDVAINEGNSGGPLFDMRGNVVGITTGKFTGSTSSGTVIEGLGFAIPINDVAAILDNLQQYGYVTGKAYLGISVSVVDAKIAEIYDLPAGVHVMTVEEGSCAEKSGLQAGDLITAIDDTSITSRSELVTALKNYSAGDSAILSIYRNGQTLHIEVVLDEKPRDPSDTPIQSETESTSVLP